MAHKSRSSALSRSNAKTGHKARGLTQTVLRTVMADAAPATPPRRCDDSQTPSAAGSEAAASADTDQQVKVVMTLAISGGGLNATWTPRVQIEDGVPFLRLTSGDTKLMEFLGVGADKEKMPVISQVFARVVGAREQEIIRLLVALKEQDPRNVGRSRRDLMDDLPGVVEVSVGEHRLKVLNASAHHAGAAIECSEDNMKWLRSAVHSTDAVEGPRTGRKRPHSETSQPWPEFPDIHWHEVTAEGSQRKTGYLYATYVGTDGQRHRKHWVPKRTGGDWEEAKREMAATAQQWCRDIAMRW